MNVPANSRFFIVIGVLSCTVGALLLLVYVPAAVTMLVAGVVLTVLGTIFRALSR